MARPSSVTPPVEPSQPTAPGAMSFSHRSTAARRPSASDVLPWMTWMNMASLLSTSWSLSPAPRTLGVPAVRDESRESRSRRQA